MLNQLIIWSFLRGINGIDYLSVNTVIDFTMSLSPDILRINGSLRCAVKIFNVGLIGEVTSCDLS